MAEFSEVLRKFDRMCKANAVCYNCPLHEPDGVDRCSIGSFVDDSERIERGVMKWAKEHPEPVYPSWLEWFRQIEIIPSDQIGFHTWLHNPIPTDIAQRLGLQPKEG